MNRTDLAISHLTEEWDNVIVLCSSYDNTEGLTYGYKHVEGNAFAVQQMLEDEIDSHIFQGGCDGEEEG